MKRGLQHNVARVAKLFRGFRLRAPREAREISHELPAVVMRMGRVHAIEYVMPRGSRSVLYRHEFAPGSGPDLNSGPGPCELVLTGGRYHVTHRGIVDLTPGGRERE